MKFKEISNIELDNILKNVKQFNGVYMKDEIPKDLKDGFYIINLDDSKNDGTHWCVFYKNPTINVYFDSYGFLPPEELSKQLKPYRFNHKQIQSVNSKACGYYCIAFIKFMINKKDINKSFDIFKQLFNDIDYNEEVLNQLLNCEII
jgi:hypothetical protein